MRTVSRMHLEALVSDLNQERERIAEQWETMSLEELHFYDLTRGLFSMASQVFKDYRTLIQELETQGWKTEQLNGTHWRVTPADATKEMVHFAMSDDPHAYENNLTRLRKSGFVWPPPSKAEQRAERKSGPGPLTQRLDLSEVQLAPSSIEEVQTNSVEVILPEGAALQQKDLQLEEDSTDRLFRELKEAKAYVVLADEALDEAKREMKAMKAKLDAAEKEFTRAADRLRQKKDAFDRAFNAASAA
jgi:hypothetical protein